MNLDERMENSGTYGAFRTSLDIGMGAVYIILGVIVLSLHSFGFVELSTTVAYVLGTMMVLYGAFRIYRGMVEILRKKNSRTSRRTE